MRLLLTSNGFPAESTKLRKIFAEMVGKPLHEIRVAFIPTASEVERDQSFVSVDRKELEEMGIPGENITDLKLAHQVTAEELNQYDVIFVDGGNTFYLLQKVRESEFDTALRTYLERDRGLYVGVSAGTVLTGPDIGFVEPWDDRSKATLTDTKGLGYTKEAYSPHYIEKEKEILDDRRAKESYTIRELRDGEAVAIRDGVHEFIRK